MRHGKGNILGIPRLPLSPTPASQKLAGDPGVAFAPARSLGMTKGKEQLDGPDTNEEPDLHGFQDGWQPLRAAEPIPRRPAQHAKTVRAMSQFLHNCKDLQPSMPLSAAARDGVSLGSRAA